MNDDIKPDDLSEEEIQTFLDEIRRLTESFRQLDETPEMSERDKQIARFKKMHEEDMIVEAQKECFLYVEIGGYLH